MLLETVERVQECHEEEDMKKAFTVMLALALFVVFAFASTSIAAKKTGTGKKSIEEPADDTGVAKAKVDKTKAPNTPENTKASTKSKQSGGAASK